LIKRRIHSALQRSEKASLTSRKLGKALADSTFGATLAFVRQISIYYYPKQGGEKKVIPVNYEVEQRDDLLIKIIHCTVALSTAEIPDWLRPCEFDLIVHPGNVVAAKDAADETFLSMLDADAFRYKVYGKIVGLLNPV
jgi:hypothetical protein